MSIQNQAISFSFLFFQRIDVYAQAHALQKKKKKKNDLKLKTICKRKVWKGRE